MTQEADRCGQCEWNKAGKEQTSIVECVEIAVAQDQADQQCQNSHHHVIGESDEPNACRVDDPSHQMSAVPKTAVLSQMPRLLPERLIHARNRTGNQWRHAASDTNQFLGRAEPR